MAVFKRYMSSWQPIPVLDKRGGIFGRFGRNILPTPKEPYDLPRLVVDLDAVDCQYVRKWEDIPHEYQETPNIWMPKKARRVNVRDTHFMSTIIAPDLVAYALRGPPSRWAAEKKELNRQIAKQELQNTELSNQETLNSEMQVQDIPATFSHLMKEHAISTNHTRNIQRLIYNFIEDPNALLARAGFRRGKRSGNTLLAGEIATCREWPEIRRIISMLASTENGRAFLAEHGRAIRLGIRSCLESQVPAEPWNHFDDTDIVRFINHLTNNIILNGGQIHTDICNTGLHYACRAGILPAVRKYLQIHVGHSYTTDSTTSSSILSLYSPLLFGNVAALPEASLREFQVLLTGTSLHDGRTVDHPGEPCFADLIFQQFAVLQNAAKGQERRELEITRRDLMLAYQSYVLILGEMAWVDSLRNDWHFIMESKFPVSSSEGGLAFAVAFLLAGDEAMAQIALEATYNIEPGEWASSLKDLLTVHYDLYEAQPSESVIEECMRVSRSHLEHKGEALQMLRNLLIPASPEVYEFMKAKSNKSRSFSGEKPRIHWGRNSVSDDKGRGLHLVQASISDVKVEESESPFVNINKA
ncbi:hypothetical protein B0O99DRAFT_266059 [Bisporella sp. PMI_857]|nr:hypothetical protein B0O99DRAFT_266059 [Bisporella sp. PMI_857]